jgi:hypothetical protein
MTQTPVSLPHSAAPDHNDTLVSDGMRVRRAEEAPVVRRYSETRYGAKSRRCERRVAARASAR